MCGLINKDELRLRLNIDGVPFDAMTLRLAERRHFAIASPDNEADRLTLDHQRLFYFINNPPEEPISLEFLGNLGPRLEIKSQDKEVVEKVVNDLRLAEVGYKLPYETYELWFDYLLKKRCPEKEPEISQKLNTSLV